MSEETKDGWDIEQNVTAKRGGVVLVGTQSEVLSQIDQIRQREAGTRRVHEAEEMAQEAAQTALIEQYMKASDVFQDCIEADDQAWEEFKADTISDELNEPGIASKKVTDKLARAGERREQARERLISATQRLIDGVPTERWPEPLRELLSTQEEHFEKTWGIPDHAKGS